MQGTYKAQSSQSVPLKPGQNKLPKGVSGFVITQVDDPCTEPKINRKNQTSTKPKARVVQRTSDNPLLELRNRKRISEVQFLAGYKYMQAYLVCSGQTGQGIDYSRQRVDFTSAPLTLTEKQINAQDVIRNANRELTTQGHNTRSTNEAVIRMQRIAGDGWSVTQFCHSVLKLKSSKSISKQMGCLRDDLSALAKYWGFER